MSDPRFIHLAVRSSFSLLESMLSPKQLAAWAEEEGMPALAVTDHNNLFGALEIAETLAGAGVQPIMGCAFDVARDGDGPETYRVTLYASNDTG